jgi:hypothetical protein
VAEGTSETIRIGGQDMDEPAGTDWRREGGAPCCRVR